jgi:hypothetical protein
VLRSKLDFGCGAAGDGARLVHAGHSHESDGMLASGIDIGATV